MWEEGFGGGFEVGGDVDRLRRDDLVGTRLSAPLHRFGDLLDAGLKSGAYIGFATVGIASVLFGL